jgi:hypothetical protein
LSTASSGLPNRRPFRGISPLRRLRRLVDRESLGRLVRRAPYNLAPDRLRRVIATARNRGSNPPPRPGGSRDDGCVTWRRDGRPDGGREAGRRRDCVDGGGGRRQSRPRIQGWVMGTRPVDGRTRCRAVMESIDRSLAQAAAYENARWGAGPLAFGSNGGRGNPLPLASLIRATEGDLLPAARPALAPRYPAAPGVGREVDGRTRRCLPVDTLRVPPILSRHVH